MSFADDLLNQAHALATVDPGVPGQANLHRAVSSAYYALFRPDSVELMVPAQPRSLRTLVARTFLHSDMKQVCNRFSQRTLPESLVSLLPSGVSDDLRAVATTFSLLQQQRHEADYDVMAQFSREDALASISETRKAFGSWARIRGRDEANIFLAALAFGKRWDR